MKQVIVTLEDGRQVLVDLFASGEIEVSQRPEEGAGWVPVGLGHFPGSVAIIPAA